MSGTPAAASALAGLYLGMGDTEKAAAVVVRAAEAASRGDHVSSWKRVVVVSGFPVLAQQEVLGVT